MRLLSNDILMDTYNKAVEMQLEREFINMLLMEIHRRDLKIPNRRQGA